MNKIELGGLVTLVIAIVTATYYISTLYHRVTVLENLTERGTTVIHDRLPAKSIIAWAGQEANLPRGWVICGQNGTVNLDRLFLIGTNDWGKVGTVTGEKTHDHHVSSETGHPYILSGDYAPYSSEDRSKEEKKDGPDEYLGDSGKRHRHSGVTP